MQNCRIFKKEREVADTPNSNGKRADLNPVKMTAQLADTLGALNRQPSPEPSP